IGLDVGLNISTQLGLGGDQDVAGDVDMEDDSYAHVTFSESKLDEALAEDYDAVLQLIGAVNSGTTDSGDIEFTSSTAKTRGGVYDVRVEYGADGKAYKAWIKLESEETYRQLQVSGDKLLGQFGDAGSFGNPEKYLELTVVQGAASETRNYKVNVRKGIAGEIYDRLQSVLDNQDGTVALKRDSYTSSNPMRPGSINLIDKKIEREETRLGKMQERLEQKYARLESLLAELDSQRGAFQSLFDSLDANRNSNKD
ncbi:MAG: flagellar filament capping protein FliD, partial [Planctomycetes bacterium]|nr:flagellar filament capping protein FliD [Planctomycetota bacterium]